MGAHGGEVHLQDRTLDWRSLAWLIAERAPHPVLVLDGRGEVRMATSGASNALGWPQGALQGRTLRQTLAPPDRTEPVCSRLEQALDGLVHRMRVQLRAADDRLLDVTCECAPFGEHAERCVVVAICSVREVMPAPCGTTQGETSYEVSLKPAELGRLVRPADGQPRELGGASQLCFQAIHGASSPCVDCPLFRAEEDPWPRVSVHREAASGVYRVRQARKVNDNLALVTVYVIPDASLAALNEANVRHVAAKARLTDRERSVVRCILLGRATEEIAETLGIKPRTVKFHQQNALNKLGADSRIDLFRLFFSLATDETP